LWFSITNLFIYSKLPVIDDNQDEWLHRSNIFSHDKIVNVDIIGDESTLLEVPLSKIGKYLIDVD
jgi:hypothetical protein